MILQNVSVWVTNNPLFFEPFLKFLTKKEGGAKNPKIIENKIGRQMNERHTTKISVLQVAAIYGNRKLFVILKTSD